MDLLQREPQIAVRFFKRCKLRRPNDIVAIKACIQDAVKMGVLPQKIWAEDVPDKPSEKAILYSVPLKELVKDFLRKEDNVEVLIENVLDMFYDELGDKFRTKEDKYRRDMKKWARKIIL